MLILGGNVAADLHGERGDGRVTLVGVALIGKDRRERVGAVRIGEAVGRRIPARQQVLDIGVGAGDVVGERRHAGDRRGIERRGDREDTQVLAEIGQIAVIRVQIGEIRIGAGDQLELHRGLRAADLSGRRGVERHRQVELGLAACGEVRQQGAIQVQIVGDLDALRRHVVDAALELHADRIGRDRDAGQAGERAAKGFPP